MEAPRVMQYQGCVRRLEVSSAAYEVEIVEARCMHEVVLLVLQQRHRMASGWTSCCSGLKASRQRMSAVRCCNLLETVVGP